MHAGPYIHKENLQFGFDSGYSPTSAGKTKSRPTRSNRGRPTTNYIGNGNFSNGNGIENQYGSWGTYEIQTLKNPGKSPYVLAQRTGEYEIHFKSGTSIQPSTTYCQSCWVAYSKDWNGNTQIHHSRYYNGSGTGYAIGGAGTLARTRKIKGLTWEFRYATFTTQSTVNGNYNWYLGYSAGATTGWRYIADVKLEVGSYPTPFTKESRSSSESLINMNRDGSTINASTVSFDSNGIPTFDGTDDYIRIGDIVPDAAWTEPFSVECVLKIPSGYSWNTSRNSNIVGRGSYGGSHGLVMTTTNNTLGGWVRGDNGAISAGTTITRDIWYHIIFTWDGLYSRIYKNGELADTAGGTARTGVPDGGNWDIAYNKAFSGSVGSFFQGDIAVAKIYSGALGLNKVKRNFLQYKSRFGL